MSAQDTSGPAFPSSNTPETGFYAEGMTLRDYFAAKAMQVAPEEFGFWDRAQWAYKQANAMLQARETQP